MNRITQDFKIIASLIKENSLVLDLGCAEGNLLEYLVKTKNIQARGIEKDLKLVVEVLEKGLSVYQGDIEEGLGFYKDNFFDTIILSKTIQELSDPKKTIFDMLKIGERAVISFLNYGYYQNRINFFFKGIKPKNLAFPYHWYNSPEIHPLTIKDFEIFCRRNNIKIIKRHYLKGDWQSKNSLLPNLFCGFVIYLIAKK